MSDLIKLDSNESPWDLPPSLKRRAIERIESSSFNRYPDALAAAVREQIARNQGVKPGQVVLGNGLDEVILMVALAFGAGRRTIIPVPGFSTYKMATLLAGAAAVEVPLVPWFDLDLTRLLEEASREPGLVFICNPYNPTGRRIAPQVVERLLLETRSTIVVDEAYWEFAGASCLPMLEANDRLIILRTLSKAFSLAGIRLGYALLSADAAVRLERARMPYNVSSLTLAVASVVLEDDVYVKEVVSKVIAERDRVFGVLQASPRVVPLPSVANFILFTASRPAAALRDRLLDRGISVRAFPDEPLLADYLRVSIGTQQEDDAFLGALDRLLANDDERAVIRSGFHA